MLVIPALLTKIDWPELLVNGGDHAIDSGGIREIGHIATAPSTNFFGPFMNAWCGGHDGHGTSVQRQLLSDSETNSGLASCSGNQGHGQAVGGKGNHALTVLRTSSPTRAANTSV